MRERAGGRAWHATLSSMRASVCIKLAANRMRVCDCARRSTMMMRVVHPGHGTLLPSLACTVAGVDDMPSVSVQRMAAIVVNGRTGQSSVVPPCITVAVSRRGKRQQSSCGSTRRTSCRSNDADLGDGSSGSACRTAQHKLLMTSVWRPRVRHCHAPLRVD